MASRSCMHREALVRERRLRLPGDLRKCGLVAHREIREHLAIDLDVGPLHSGHECAVAQAQFAHRGIDPGDPQPAKIALAIAAVAVRILSRLHHRLLRYAKDILAATAKTFRLGEDFLVARARRNSAFYAWHGALLSCTAASRGLRACCCRALRSDRAGGAFSWWSSS